jgi:L-ascorbate metabolism protein UlaG (beta-lactamase superfamily)
VADYRRRTTVLVDPYLSRLKRTSPNDDVSADDTRPLYSNDDRPEPDAKVIDAHIVTADVIVVRHTHSDHAFDVPYIARKTGATVVGTESTYYVARAYGTIAGISGLFVDGPAPIST